MKKIKVKKMKPVKITKEKEINPTDFLKVKPVKGISKAKKPKHFGDTFSL
jgi:hypothetical protein